MPRISLVSCSCCYFWYFKPQAVANDIPVWRMQTLCQAIRPLYTCISYSSTAQQLIFLYEWVCIFENECFAFDMSTAMASKKGYRNPGLALCREVQPNWMSRLDLFRHPFRSRLWRWWRSRKHRMPKRPRSLNSYLASEAREAPHEELHGKLANEKKKSLKS